MDIEITEKASFSAVLKNKNFLILWLGQVFSQLADKILLLYLVILITSISSANTLISGLFIVFTVPAMFVGSIAGVFIDRWNKKWVLIFTNILRALLLFILPLYDTSIVYIYIISFFISTVTQFFAPAESTMIPAIVDKKDLMAANTLFTVTMLSSIVIGFSLGEPLVSVTLQHNLTHLSIAFLYIISTIFLLFIKGHGPGISSCKLTNNKFFSELKEGINYIIERKNILSPILKQLVLFSVHAAMSVLVIGFTRDVLHLEEKYFAYIMAIMGLGMAIGGFIIVKIKHNLSNDILTNLGCIAMGVFISILAFVNIRFVVLLLALLIGIGAAAIVVPSQTSIQENTAVNMRGKVFGVQSVLNNTAMTLPAALAGILADIWGVSNTILIIGIITLCIGIISFYKYK